MAKGRGKSTKKISATTATIVIIIAVIFYILDAVGGLGNKDIEGNCEFHFIDVGQGDCTLIISEDAAIVIDAGPGDHADSTEKYIKSYTDTIDYLILTHPHEDHIGGADEIIESINVKNIIMSDASTDTATFTVLLDAVENSGANVIEAKSGDEYTAGDIVFTILSPVSDFTNYNDYSIVTKVEFGNTSAMITGDVEQHSEKLIIEKFKKGFLRSDIYQVSHHGSSTSNSSAFFSAISPKYAVIQCEDGNSYGHPHREIIKELENRNIEYYRTDKIGHVVFTSDGEKVEYKDQ